MLSIAWTINELKVNVRPKYSGDVRKSSGVAAKRGKFAVDIIRGHLIDIKFKK